MPILSILSYSESCLESLFDGDSQLTGDTRELTLVGLGTFLARLILAFNRELKLAARKVTG